MGNKITSGVWFVFIGLILLLHNLDVIDFNFIATIKYWPLLIVIVGINLIVQNKEYGSYLKISCNVLFLGWVFYVGMTAPKSDWAGMKGVYFPNLDNDASFTNEVRLPMDSVGINEASLQLNGGASKLTISGDPGEDLIVAKSPENGMAMNLENKKTENEHKLELNIKPTNGGKESGAVETKINNKIPWNMEINVGASNVSADLSTIDFKKIEVNSGASTIDFTLGNPSISIAKLDIASGASSITLHIPKEVAVKLTYESFLSKNNFEGFQPLVDGVTKTANYDTSSKKFDISVEGATNTVNITRY